MCVCAHACYIVIEEVRGQFLDIAFFFPPCRFQGLNSVHHIWQKAPLHIELFLPVCYYYQPLQDIFFM